MQGKNKTRSCKLQGFGLYSRKFWSNQLQSQSVVGMPKLLELSSIRTFDRIRFSCAPFIDWLHLTLAYSHGPVLVEGSFISKRTRDHSYFSPLANVGVDY